MLQNKLPHTLVPRVVANFTFTEVMTYAERGGEPFLSFVESARLMPRSEMDGKTYDFQIASSEPFPKISTEAALVWIKSRIHPGPSAIRSLNGYRPLSAVCELLRGKMVTLGRERGVIEFDFRGLLLRPPPADTDYTYKSLYQLTNFLFEDVSSSVDLVIIGRTEYGSKLWNENMDNFHATYQIKYMPLPAIRIDVEVLSSVRPSNFVDTVTRSLEDTESCAIPESLSPMQRDFVDRFHLQVVELKRQWRGLSNETLENIVSRATFPTWKDSYFMLRRAIVPMLSEAFRVVRNSIPNADALSVFILVLPNSWGEMEERLAADVFKGIRKNGKWTSIGGIPTGGDLSFEAQ